MIKQTEIFAFLALFFLLSVFFVEMEREQEARTPPIIVLSEERDEYKFGLGSANVPSLFVRALTHEVVPLLDSLSTEYDCDVIEVVGHTDGSIVGGQDSDLDHDLAAAYREGRANELNPGSNVDLGMLRAVAIINILQDLRSPERLGSIRYFYPYSAGQIIRLDKTISEAGDFAPDSQRRRIEIRLLRSETPEMR